MKKITKRQFEIAGFIRDFIGKNAISPTLYDIAEYFSIKPSTAAAHIAALERKRVIVRQKGRRRSIRPVGMGSGLPQKVPICVPFYLKKNSLSGAPSSFYHVDASLLPDHVRAKDLFAVRLGVFNGLPQNADVEPGDVLIVWTRPERLHPGTIVLERSGSAPSCRQVTADSEPEPGVLGQVIALLRPLK
jgi:SOS-response transcriptional repressor LexA